MIETDDFTMAENEEEAFWAEKKSLSEELIKGMEKDLEQIPKLINFHKAVICMCEQKMKDSISCKEVSK